MTSTGVEALLAELHATGLGLDRHQAAYAAKVCVAAATCSSSRPGDAMPFWTSQADRRG